MFGLLSGMGAISENSAGPECGRSAAAVKPFASHCRNSLGYEGCLSAGGAERDDPPAFGIPVSHNGFGDDRQLKSVLNGAASVSCALWSGADAGIFASLRSLGNLPRGEFRIRTDPHLDEDHDRARGRH